MPEPSCDPDSLISEKMLVLYSQNTCAMTMTQVIPVPLAGGVCVPSSRIFAQNSQSLNAPQLFAILKRLL